MSPGAGTAPYGRQAAGAVGAAAGDTRHGAAALVEPLAADRVASLGRYFMRSIARVFDRHLLASAVREHHPGLV